MMGRSGPPGAASAICLSMLLVAASVLSPLATAEAMGHQERESLSDDRNEVSQPVRNMSSTAASETVATSGGDRTDSRSVAPATVSASGSINETALTDYFDIDTDCLREDVFDEDATARNLSNHYVACSYGPMYDSFRTKQLSEAYWEAKADKALLDAIFTVYTTAFGAMNSKVADVAGITWDAVYKQEYGKAAGSAGITLAQEQVIPTESLTAKTVTTYTNTKTLFGFISALGQYLTANEIARNVNANGNQELRDNLEALEENSEDIDSANRSQRQSLYRERKQLLEETQRSLPGYYSSLQQSVISNPAYRAEIFEVNDPFSQESPPFTLGSATYKTLRWAGSGIRQTIAADYYATNYWLNNGTAIGEPLPDATNTYMPAHQLTYSDETSRAFGAMDRRGDYAIYQINVTEEQEAAGRDLTVVVQGKQECVDRDPDDGSPRSGDTCAAELKYLDAYLTRERPDPDYDNVEKKLDDEFAENPSNGLVDRTITNAEAGSYYLLVRGKTRTVTATRDGEELSASASVNPPYAMWTTAWNSYFQTQKSAPEIRLIEAGAAKTLEPTYPTPGVSVDLSTASDASPGSRRTVEPGEEVSINVSATNYGGEASLQSVVVGLPNATAGSVSVTDTTGNAVFAGAEVVEPGEEFLIQNQSYVETPYPLVNISVEEWENEDTGTIELTATVPPGETEYRVNYRATAQSPARYDRVPKPEESGSSAGWGTPTLVSKYNVTTTPEAATERWTDPAGPLRQNYLPAGTAPTANPTVAWRHNLPDGQTAAGTPIVTDSRLYLSTESGRVYAFARSNGSRLWEREFDGEITTSLELGGDSLYVGTTEGSVYALARDDGATRWSFDTHAAVRARPLYEDDIVHVPTADGTLYQLSSDTGIRRDRETYGGGQMATPQRRNDTLYTTQIIDSQVRLLGLNATSGNVTLTQNVSGTTGATAPAPPVLTNGKAFVTGGDGTMYVLDITDGAELWTADLGSGIRPAPAVVDGYVYAAASNGSVVVYDETQGRHLTEYETPRSLRRSPVVLDGRVFVGTATYRLAGLRSTTLAERFMADAVGPITTRPVVVDGRAFYSDANGTVFAVDSASSPTAALSVSTATGTAVPGEPLTLDADESTDRGGSIDTVQWYVDGTPVGTGERSSYVPTSAGVKNVTLVVTDSDGNSDSARRTVRVHGPSSWAGPGLGPTRTGYRPVTPGPSGTVIEQFVTETYAPVERQPVLGDRHVYAGTDDGFVTAVDDQTGETEWRTELDGELGQQTVVGETVYAPTAAGTLYALNASSGDIRWQQEVGTVVGGPTVANGSVVVSTGERLLALERQSGARQWERASGDGYSPAAVESGRVYVTVTDGGATYLRSLGVEGGYRRWETRLSQQSTARPPAPAVADNTVYAGGASGRLTAVVARSGRVDAQVDLGSAVEQSPVVVSGTTTGTRIYVVTADGELVGVESSVSGLSTANSLAGVGSDRPPLVAGSTVYKTTDDGRVVALEERTLDRQWTHEVPSASTTPTVGNGTVYLGTSDGRLLAVGSERTVDARRTVESVPVPGETVNVTVSLPQQPAVDTLSIDESLPGGLSVTGFSANYDLTEESDTTWTWAESNGTEPLRLTYTVAVPASARGTTYDLDGAVSAGGTQLSRVGGTQSLTVGRCVRTAVSGRDRFVSLSELQWATELWAESAAVPYTGGETITTSQLRSLTVAWRTHSTVSC